MLTLAIASSAGLHRGVGCWGRTCVALGIACQQPQLRLVACHSVALGDYGRYVPTECWGLFAFVFKMRAVWCRGKQGGDALCCAVQCSCWNIMGIECSGTGWRDCGDVR